MLLADQAVPVVQVPEDDRSGRTCILASRSDIPVMNLAIASRSGVDLAVLNPLNAVGAFFHNTTPANGDLGVQDQRLKLATGLLSLVLPSVKISVFVVVVEVVKTPDFVGTVVRAVAGTDATVVSHRVDAFFGVNGRSNRANLFAWRRFAMGTSHRLHNDLGVQGAIDRAL